MKGLKKGEGDRVSGNTGIKEKVWHGSVCRGEVLNII